MRRHFRFILIPIGTATCRFAILFLSQTHLTSDEAIIGLMTKHISEGRAFSFYFYGISYNASCAWEAYLAVIPFRAKISAAQPNKRTTRICRLMERLESIALRISFRLRISYVQCQGIS
jgi:hypothetical protein